MTPGRARRLLPLAFLVLVLGGCYRMSLRAEAIEPYVYLSGDLPAGSERVAPLEASTRTSWLLWGYREVDDGNLEGVILRELQRAGGTGVVGLEIRTRRTFVDGLLTLLTLGIYSQRTTELEGTIVRATGGEP